ncbi:MAG: DUF2442 domain-containing protein [Candidatus Hydrogenedentes bacterium]|nr:DUF2442 domain-containing protein [Candidatus Hydrogenedentota bacterium]
MPRIIKATVLDRYRLDLTFDDGVSGIVDLSHLAGQGVFARWLEPGAFEDVRIAPSGEVTWGTDIDLCPDTLYLDFSGKAVADLFPSSKRAHIHA